MRTWLQLEMRPKPAHPVQEDVDFLILLNIISFILYTAETFLKVIVFLFCFSFCNFEVLSFILVLENKCDCSPNKSALSCFVAFSVPCPGLLCHFLSPVVFVVSLYLILFSLLASCVYIYISGGPLSALTCCVNARLLSAIKKISPLIYSQSWVESWVYTTQAMMTFTLIF